jgi:hypothetical protein
MSDVEVLQVIRTTLKLRGNGTTEKPYRRITQYWDMEGNLLVEEDPFIKEGEWKDESI